MAMAFVAARTFLVVVGIGSGSGICSGSSVCSGSGYW